VRPSRDDWLRILGGGYTDTCTNTFHTAELHVLEDEIPHLRYLDAVDTHTPTLSYGSIVLRRDGESLRNKHMSMRYLYLEYEVGPTNTSTYKGCSRIRRRLICFSVHRMRCQPGLRNRKAVKGMASAIADGVVVAVHPHLLDVTVTVTVTVTVCHGLSLCHCLGMSGDVTRPPNPRVRGDSRGWLYKNGWV